MSDARKVPRLFTNQSGPDTVRNAFQLFSGEASDILLASPFFSNDELVGGLLDRGSHVRLIVRLGPATDSAALSRLCRRERVQIRYFTSSTFHCKLYIFGEAVALVGSANLTAAGMGSNRELALTIAADDARFDELVRVYQRLWSEAEPFTAKGCAAYEALQASRDARKVDPFESAVREAFGDVAPSGLQVGRPTPSKEIAFLASYRRTYQEFLAAFAVVEGRYKHAGRRKQPESLVPLRIEIDQFFSYLRERFTRGESYLAEPYRAGVELDQFIDERLADWFAVDWKYLTEAIPGKCLRAASALNTPDTIRKATAADLFDAIDICHSVHDRLRFFPGGHKTLRETFLTLNDVDQIRKVLVHLLHGPGDYVERLTQCIFGDEYHLQEFGRAAVQELYGWVNSGNVPICNGRTVKALRYLGFNVLVFDAKE